MTLSPFHPLTTTTSPNPLSIGNAKEANGGLVTALASAAAWSVTFFGTTPSTHPPPPVPETPASHWSKRCICVLLLRPQAPTERRVAFFLRAKPCRWDSIPGRCLQATPQALRTPSPTPLYLVPPRSLQPDPQHARMLPGPTRDISSHQTKETQYNTDTIRLKMFHTTQTTNNQSPTTHKQIARTTHPLFMS